jgi:hypothetical protein
MLLACNNDRLKLFILILASAGTRSMETLSIRNHDINFEYGSPIKLHIIAENTKTGQDRDVYISNEAFEHLKRFVERKYNDKLENIKSRYPNDLVFSSWRTDKIQPIGIYGVLHKQFAGLLRKVEMAHRKDGQGIQRRKISFHLFRDYVKTTVSKLTTKDFSEWMLGHSGSTYWNVEEDDTKQLYLKCMKYLTFLDYDVVEVVGADFESKLIERDREVELLQQRIGKLETLQNFLKQSEGFSLQRTGNKDDDTLLEIDIKALEKLKEQDKWKDVLDTLGLKQKKWSKK